MANANHVEIETQVEKHIVIENKNLVKEENIAKIKKESLEVENDVTIVSTKSETLHVEKDVNIKNENLEDVGNADILLIKNENSQIDNPVIQIEEENITCGDGDENNRFEVEVKIANVDVENKDVHLDENKTNIFKPIDGSQNYRLSEFGLLSDSDSSSILSSDSSDSDSDSFFEELHKSVPKLNPVITKDEVLLDELPPVEYLHLTVPEHELEKLGKITGIVDKLVVIQAIENLSALDEGSVIFLSPTEPLGQVYEVFGPVNKPFYSVRFNSNEDIIEKGITVHTCVLYAPKKHDLALYVLIENLKLQKGSDASWQNNTEPPEEFIDYSDDEKEQNAKKKKKAKNRKPPKDDDDDDITVCFHKKKAPCFGSPKPPSRHFGSPKPSSHYFGSPKPPPHHFESPKPPPHHFGSPKPPPHHFGSPIPPSHHFGLSSTKSTPAPDFRFLPTVSTPGSDFRFLPPVSTPAPHFQFSPHPSTPNSHFQFLPVSTPSPHFQFPPSVSSSAPYFQLPPPLSTSASHFRFPPPASTATPGLGLIPPASAAIPGLGLIPPASAATPGLGLIPPASAATPHFGLIPPTSSPAHFNFIKSSHSTSPTSIRNPPVFRFSAFDVPPNIISSANTPSTVLSRIPPPNPHYQ